MSWQAVRDVFDRSRMKGPPFLLLLAIAEMINDDSGICFPSMETLAKRARMSSGQAYAHMNTLRASGELVVESRKGRVNTYRLGILTPPEIRSTPGIRRGVSGNPEGGLRESGGGSPGIRRRTISKPPIEPTTQPTRDARDGKSATQRPVAPNGYRARVTTQPATHYPKQPDPNNHGKYADFLRRATADQQRRTTDSGPDRGDA